MRNYAHTIVLLFFPLLFVNSTAQDLSQNTRCFSHENLMNQIADHPEMLQQMQALERQTEQYTNSKSVQLRGGTITIPVVIHVVYRTDAENISTAQVQSQIDVLNRDYGKQNTDISKVPIEFKNVAADCQIRFQLATRDPQARSTTGIVRYATTKTTWGANDDVKKPAKGGYANWDPSKYLNIYVCNIGNGILGYGSFPSSPVILDGVVIDYTVFGTMGTARAPFNKGRTTTHEVGHWLNLVHTWGDLDCGDDFVGDTPKHKEAHYGDVTTPQYSYCAGRASRDMTMNFMDYVNDDCMYMFTVGQKDRIQAVFASARASILTSDGCATSTCNVGKPTISDIKTTSANIIWNEISGMNKYTVEYKMANLPNWTVSQTSSASLTINGLVGGATYVCRIKGDCAENTYSDEVTFKTATTTSSKAIESNAFSIYPNPVVQNVSIMFDVLNDGLVNVKIFDSNGVLKTQVAKNVTQRTPAISLDLTEFPSGFYLVVAEKDGQREVKKLLKVSN